RADDVDFILADADGLDEDDVAAGGVEDESDLARRAREASEVAAGRHAADEHTGIARVRLHADAVAEDRAAREGAGRIDRDHADGAPRLPDPGGEPVDERALAGARRPGHADEVGAAGAREDAANQLGAGRGL